MEVLHSRRTYDYRIQEAICESGDRELFPELNTPRPTIRKRLGSGETCRTLREAVAQLNDCPGHAVIVADSGSETVNGAVDDLLDSEELTRVLAQTEVTFSNSMIEAFWRSLNHSWLYVHSLDSIAGPRVSWSST